jgi:hypothetical protein
MVAKGDIHGGDQIELGWGGKCVHDNSSEKTGMAKKKMNCSNTSARLIPKKKNRF